MSQAFKTQYLTCFLALLAGWPRFCLVVVGLIAFIVGLFIGGVESIGREVAIGFSGCSL